VRTRETDKPEYLANGTDRCYHCKAELYDVLARIAAEERLPVVVSGANLDDILEWYDGLDRDQVKAVIDFAVRSLDPSASRR